MNQRCMYFTAFFVVVLLVHNHFTEIENIYKLLS